MHCGVPSIISAMSAIFFATAALCFSDSRARIGGAEERKRRNGSRHEEDA